jgi:hypothetical protein
MRPLLPLGFLFEQLWQVLHAWLMPDNGSALFRRCFMPAIPDLMPSNRSVRATSLRLNS